MEAEHAFLTLRYFFFIEESKFFIAFSGLNDFVDKIDIDLTPFCFGLQNRNGDIEEDNWEVAVEECPKGVSEAEVPDDVDKLEIAIGDYSLVLTKDWRAFLYDCWHVIITIDLPDYNL
jgi:hypothetical protein